MRPCRSRVLSCLLLTISAQAGAATFNVTKTADTNDGTCNADCSLREAVRAANSAPGADLVVLPPGTYTLTLPGSEDLAATGDLDLQDHVRISGAAANLTTVAGTAGRVFHVDPEDNQALQVELANLTVAAGNDDFGGGILNHSSLTLSGVRLTGNVATSGGGLWTDGPTTVVNSTVDSNQAITNGSLANGYGGGIHAFDTTLTFTGTTIAGNAASRNGAGVYAMRSQVHAASGTRFALNTAGNTGGAIESVGTSGDRGLVTLAGTFEQNGADDGGAISNLEHSTVECSGCVFTGNHADGTAGGGGGAIFNFDGEVIISGCSFTGNRSRNEGGGAIENAGTNFGGVMSISASTFDSNIAFNPAPVGGGNPGLGGALLLIDGSTTTISASSFSGNTAGQSGGAIYIDQDATVSILGGTIVDNVAQSNFGGAILNEGNTRIEGVVIARNTAVGFGGGISSASSPSGERSRVATLYIRASEIVENRGGDAGGLGNFNGATLTIDDSLIALNETTKTSLAFGGGLLMDSGQGRITNTTFSGNRAGAGGAVSNNGSGASSLVLAHATIFGNTATAPGGGSALARFNGGSTSLRNSLVGGNCNVAMTSLGGNIESPGNTCGFALASDARNVASLQLGALAANGGPTRTHNPAAGSLAVDFVAPGSCLDAAGAVLTRDQRGFLRPYDGNGDLLARCDAGAVERQPVDLIFADGFE